MSDTSAKFEYTPEQKKSLYRWAFAFYFAGLLFPLIHQILAEEIDWVPGSFSNALFKASKLSINFLLLHGLFVQMQRAMGIAEGTWGKKAEVPDSGSAEGT